MYKVLTAFADLQDNNYRYQAGDEFPREGMAVSEERLNELLTDQNRRHKPMIEEVKPAESAAAEEEKPKTQPKKGGKKKTDAK